MCGIRITVITAISVESNIPVRNVKNFRYRPMLLLKTNIVRSDKL